MGEQNKRGLDLLRQGEALLRQALPAVAPGRDTRTQQQMLADQLFVLGVVLTAHDEGTVEGEACLREALALGEGVRAVGLTLKILCKLVNLCCMVHTAVALAEAEVFRSRLNQLLVEMDRSPETSCLICVEPLAPPADGATEDAAGGGGSGGADGPPDSCVYVLNCYHQFHHGCLLTWQRTTSNLACPICKKN